MIMTQAGELVDESPDLVSLRVSLPDTTHGTATLLARHSIGAFVTQRKKNLCAIIECKFVKQIVVA